MGITGLTCDSRFLFISLHYNSKINDYDYN